MTTAYRSTFNTQTGPIQPVESDEQALERMLRAAGRPWWSASLTSADYAALSSTDQAIYDRLVRRAAQIEIEAQIERDNQQYQEDCAFDAAREAQGYR
jgi:hypothetical protein